MAYLSTRQVAEKAGISRATLERWLATGEVAIPKTVRFGEINVRQWTPADVERVRAHKAKRYRRGRGRKPKLKK